MCNYLEKINFDVRVVAHINAQTLADAMGERMVDEDVADFIIAVSQQIQDPNILEQLRDYFEGLTQDGQGEEE